MPSIFHTPRRLAWVAVLAAAASSSGCLASAPRYRQPGLHTLVHAPTPAAASHIAQLADRMLPQVRSMLPDTHDRPVEIWVQEEVSVLRGFSMPRQFDAIHFGLTGRIHLRNDVQPPDRTLAHELVHALTGDSWRTLPPCAVEGLADVVSGKVSPDERAELSLRVVQLLLTLDDVMLEVHPNAPSLERHGVGRVSWVPAPRVDPAWLLSRDVERMLGPPLYDMPELLPAFYGCGYVVVSRVVERWGFQGLHSLCVNASATGLRTVPVEQLIERAGLPSDTGLWGPVVATMVDEHGLVSLTHAFRPWILAALDDMRRPDELDWTAVEWIERIDPHLSVGGGSTSLRLASLPDFVADLVAIWEPSRVAANGVVQVVAAP